MSPSMHDTKLSDISRSHPKIATYLKSSFLENTFAVDLILTLFVLDETCFNQTIEKRFIMDYVTFYMYGWYGYWSSRCLQSKKERLTDSDAKGTKRSII